MRSMLIAVALVSVGGANNEGHAQLRTHNPAPAPAAAGPAGPAAPAAPGVVHNLNDPMPLMAAEQGFSGKDVQHKNGSTVTGDWRREFGPKGPQPFQHLDQKDCGPSGDCSHPDCVGKDCDHQGAPGLIFNGLGGLRRRPPPLLVRANKALVRPQRTTFKCPGCRSMATPIKNCKQKLFFLQALVCAHIKVHISRFRTSTRGRERRITT